jgi:transposase
MDAHGAIVLRTRLSRAQVMAFITQLPPTLMGMEACGDVHDWARRFREYDRKGKLMVPQFVKPSVQAYKNDRWAAEAMAEAVTCHTMRFVPIKAVEPQDLRALQRGRERLMKARTALINETRGLLHEYGSIVLQGPLRQHVRKKWATEDAK